MMETLEELRKKILELEGIIKEQKVEPISEEEIDKITGEI